MQRTSKNITIAPGNKSFTLHEKCKYLNSYIYYKINLYYKTMKNLSWLII